MKFHFRCLCVLALTAFIFSCNKELSLEGGNVPNDPTPIDTVYNWSFRDSGAAVTDKKAGFTDTAYIRTESGVQTFFYEGSSSDKSNGIVFQVAGQPLATGTYTGEQLAFGYFQGSALVYTNIGADSDFTLTVGYFSQDSISATFTGHVRDVSGSLIQLNDGYLRSRIGSASMNTDSVGNLICSSIVVNGEMKPNIATDFNNYVDMQVHITKAGNYTFETSVINGVLFSGEQSFADTGTFDVRLSAYGTPEQAGNFDYPITFGNSECSFNVVVAAGNEIVVDGPSGSLARQIRDAGAASNAEMRYYQTLGLIGEIQSVEDPSRKIYYNESNQISRIEVFTSDGGGGFTISEIRQFSYTPEGYVAGVTHVDDTGAFIDSVASYSYVPSSDKLASRTYYSGGVRLYQLYYTYTSGNLTQIKKANSNYTSIIETLNFAFNTSVGNGFSALHPQMYFLDVATFLEDGNYPEVLYYSANLPISKTVGSVVTPIDVAVNPSLKPTRITYGGVVWYRYEYN
jgi:hypothetical protein